MTEEAMPHDALTSFLSDKANSYSRALERARGRIGGLEQKLAALEAGRADTTLAVSDADKFLDLAAAGYHRLRLEHKPDGLRRLFVRKSKFDVAAVKFLQNTALFDRVWYLNKYPDLDALGIDPVKHYVKFGFSEGRWPSPLFDTRLYLRENLDVLKAGINPLVHFVKFGALEARRPNKLFDTGWYVKSYPDYADHGSDPLAHYLKFSASGQFDPSGGFSTKKFQADHPHLDFTAYVPLVYALHEWKTLPSGGRERSRT